MYFYDMHVRNLRSSCYLAQALDVGIMILLFMFASLGSERRPAIIHFNVRYNLRFQVARF